MRPGKQEWTGAQDLFRARLDQIINLKRELVRLAGTIDWAWIDAELAGSSSPMPPITDGCGGGWLC